MENILFFYICIYLLLGCEWNKNVIIYYSWVGVNITWGYFLFNIWFWPIEFISLLILENTLLILKNKRQ